MKKVKYVTRAGRMMNFEDGCNLEAEFFGTQFKAEGEEGMRAFLEKGKRNLIQIIKFKIKNLYGVFR